MMVQYVLTISISTGIGQMKCTSCLPSEIKTIILNSKAYKRHKKFTTYYTKASNKIYYNSDYKSTPVALQVLPLM